MFKKIVLAALVALGACYPSPKSVSPHYVNDAAVYIEVSGSWGPESSGSGAFVRPDTVLTAGHVCEDDKVHTVQLNTGETYQGKVVLDDDVKDLCLMKVEGADVAPLRLAPSSELELNEKVWFIGFPSGAVAIGEGRYFGYVPQKERKVNGVTRVSVTMTGWYGASGSAVLDKYGRVIGVLVETPTDNGMVLWVTPVEEVKQALWVMDINER